MEITIREMAPEDYDQKGYIHYKTWLETYTGLMDESLLSGQTLEKCQAIARRWPGNTLLALLDGKIVGFGCYIPHSNGPGEISAIYILKEYHNRGVGKKLLAALMAQLSPCSPIFLWVLQGNDNAIGFYQHCGFQFDGVSKALGSTSATELRMTYFGS